MTGRQLAIIIIAATVTAVLAVVMMRLLGFEGAGVIGGGVAGGVSGAIAGGWVSKRP